MILSLVGLLKTGMNALGALQAAETSVLRHQMVWKASLVHDSVTLITEIALKLDPMYGDAICWIQKN